MKTILIVLLIIVLIIYVIFNEKQKQNIITKNDTIKNDEKLPYKKKLLLTKNEWSFYKSLKVVADELNYTILSKIRLADLVEVENNEKDKLKYFNKINKKHIDFALAKKDNLQIILLIELDDNSHNEIQKERDNFIQAVCNKTDYKLLRTRGTGDLKNKILQIINN